MLKIKDDVDLKELKKYGFKEEKGYNYWVYSDGHGTKDYVFKHNKEIHTSVDKNTTTGIHDKMFDLIQANLVEKVEK